MRKNTKNEKQGEREGRQDDDNTKEINLNSGAVAMSISFRGITHVC